MNKIVKVQLKFLSIKGQAPDVVYYKGLKYKYDKDKREYFNPVCVKGLFEDLNIKGHEVIEY